MMVQEQNRTIQTFSGEGYGDLSFSHNVIYTLQVTPEVDATYDIQIVNARGIVFDIATGFKGKFDEILKLPMRGCGTLIIKNSNVDTNFHYYVSTVESYH